MEENPYATPKSNVQGPELDVEIQGGQLLVRNHTRLPPICLRTGKPTKNELVVMKVSRFPPFSFSYALSEAAKAKARRWRLLCLLLIVTLACLLVVLQVKNHEVYVIAVVICAVVYANKVRLFSAGEIVDGRLHVKGLKPHVMAAIAKALAEPQNASFQGEED